MKRTVCFVGSAMASVAACAAMLDLAGTDMTVSDVTTLASYDGVTNSSATAATLTFNIADDQAYSKTIGGKVAVVKAGAGTLDLGAVARTYSGGTQVNAGILKLGKHLSVAGTNAIRVANGAALDVCSPAALAANGIATTFPYIYIGGTGPDGNGALLNTQEATTNKKLPRVYLTDDLLVCTLKRIDIDVVYAQGHTLRFNTPSGEQFAVATFNNSAGGDISIEAGQYTAITTDNALGNTPSKGKVYMRGGKLNVWANRTLKNDVVVEAASTIQQGSSGSQATFGGTVTINAPVTFAGNAVVLNGTLYGNAELKVTSTFGNAVPASRNHFTGPIVVNSGARCAIGRKNCVEGSLNVGIVTNNGTVAWERRSAGTITNTIIGGVYTMDTDLDPNGHPTFKNFVTNTQAFVRRGTLTFGSGARWVSPEKDFRVGEQWTRDHTNVVGTVEFTDGCDVTVKAFTVGNATQYTYTNAVTEATYHNMVTGIVNQSGGLVRTVGPYGSNASEYDGVRLGHYPAGHAFWNMTGGKLIVDTYRLSLATDGYGTFNLSGGEVFTDEVNMNGRPAGKGYGILNMTGGELNVGTNGIRKSSTNNRYEIHLGGGTIRASAATGFTCPLAIDLTGANGTNVTFDTQAAAVTLSGVLSGVGGLAKAGTGTLTLSGANTYAGETRLGGGTVAFTQAYPGGDIVLPAAAQGGTFAPLLTAPGFAFAAGKGVRVTEADTLDSATFGPSKTLVSSTAPIEMPTLSLVSSDGTPFTDEKGIWRLLLVNGGKTLKFGPMRGTQILLK